MMNLPINSTEPSAKLMNGINQRHEIILEALQIANVTFDRAVCVAEINDFLTERQRAEICGDSPGTLSSIIARNLHRLLEMNQVLKAGQLSRRIYYASRKVYTVDNVRLPETVTSCRRRVLRMVEDAVQSSGKALRLCEILDYAGECPELHGYPTKMIGKSVHSLLESGNLKIVKTVRGDGRGLSLYLPAGCEVTEYLPQSPATWFEFVMSVFREIWNRHVAEAKLNKQRIAPVTTDEIRAAITATNRFPEKMRESWALLNALQGLAATRNPAIKKIRRPNLMLLFWIPVEVEESEIETADKYICDTERIGEAVRRACLRFSRPVKLKEVATEIGRDVSLKPVGPSRLRIRLSDLTKKHAGTVRGVKYLRVRWHVHRTGKIDGEAYFYHQDTPAAGNYVVYWQLLSDWQKLQPLRYINSIESAHSPLIALGRLRLLCRKISAALMQLDRFNGADAPLGISQAEISDFRAKVSRIAEVADYQLKIYAVQFPDLPEEVRCELRGWTGKTVIQTIKDFCLQTYKIEKKTTLHLLKSARLQRYLNPEFTDSTDDNPRFASEYLYDETDAKIHIAKQWGGLECRLQAIFAHSELGLLRDSRFVLPTLLSNDYNSRLAAVACLAFLPPTEINQSALRDRASKDVDAGVRQSALWAYCFAQGEDAEDFVLERKFQDPSRQVREFAGKLAEYRGNPSYAF